MKRPLAKGFTLLELLVVIATAGLIAAIGFPAIDKSIRSRAFNTAAVQVELAVREAQATAIRENRTVRLAPFVKADPRTEVALSRGAFPVDVDIEQPAALRFFRDGTSTGGTIFMASHSLRFSVTIDPLTGIITSRWT